MKGLTTIAFVTIAGVGAVFSIVAAVNEHLALGRQKQQKPHKRRRTRTVWVGVADGAGASHQDNQPARSYISGNNAMNSNHPAQVSGDEPSHDRATLER